MAQSGLDKLDNQIITLLRSDGRRTISELAADIGVSRATVRARIEKMEADGTILGYTVVLRADTLQEAVRGVMTIEIEGHVTDRVIRTLAGFPEVSEIHTTNGRWDLIVELSTSGLSQFDQVLRKIRLISGIISTETSILLSTPRSTKARL